MSHAHPFCVPERAAMFTVQNVTGMGGNLLTVRLVAADERVCAAEDPEAPPNALGSVETARLSTVG